MFELSGTVGVNYAPYANHTFPNTLTSVTLGATGKVGKAYSFNGSTSAVTSGNGESTGITNGWAASANKSISVIFKLGADGVDTPNSNSIAIIRYLRMHVRKTTNEIQIRYDAASAFSAVYAIGNGDRNWHIATGTYEYIDATHQTVKLYVDGVLRATTSGTLTPTIPYTNDAGSVGRYNSVFFTGSMQHLMYVKRLITLDEHVKMAKIAGLA